MNTLGIQCAQQPHSLSVKTHEGTTHSTELKCYKQSEELIYEIDALCEKASININNLDAIGLTYGPGSYTGLRLSISTAKTIHYVQKTPIYSIATLDALITQAMHLDGIYLAITKATRRDTNAQLFAVKQQEITPLTYPFTWTHHTMIEQCKHFEEPIVIVGEWPEIVKNDLQLQQTLRWKTETLRADSLADIAAKRYKNNVPPTPQDNIVPFYAHDVYIGKKKGLS